MARVLLENVTKRFEGVENPAVDDVSLEAADGEFLVLVGPSGCGKSTTLRMIAGLEDLTAGRISIGDRVVNDVAPKDRDIAMIFQNYALYPHMTVYQNMGFGLKMRRFDKAQIDRRVREAAETLGLTEYLDRKPKALSGGQRQRVAVGRAIVREPSVFLFDEPLSNLDAKMRVTMRAEIRALHRQLGTTMLYVTHDQIEAMTMGDRIAVMNEGKLLQIADPRTLYDKPKNKFVAGFIGMPPMNFISGRVAGKGDNIEFRTDDISWPVEARNRAKLASRIDDGVTLGFRPEDLKEVDAAATNVGRELRVIVENLEPLGSEVVLYGRIGEAAVVARVPADCRARVGDKLPMSLDMTRVHYFDAQSEARIE